MCIRDRIYSIEQLKEMFCVADKYERINDFMRKVVEAAKKELDGVSPYTFEYTPVSYTHLDVYKRQGEYLNSNRGEVNRQYYPTEQL